ncbi:4'-phosphopantetheinyl transferase superfamily protein [Christiangramia aquimixticola]|uniref:4'-phosphopantetheinyl transferase superfamily protein n=1 Tax=Christiangramia aquimixticola TaxID=1697558 RepID=UPI003AA87D71
MIGNDIIDLEIALKLPKSDNIRFMNKVFSEEEKLHIFRSTDPEIQLWKIWSMKETAYKAHQRNYNFKPVLNPIKFRCFPNTGKVEIGTSIYSTQTEVTSEFIHTRIKSSAYQISNTGAVEKDLIKFMSTAFNAQIKDLLYYKDSHNLPECINLKTRIRVPVSLSHHGKFAAYVFPLINC